MDASSEQDGVEDDLLLRALDGDLEAAVALRKRQLARTASRRRAAAASAAAAAAQPAAKAPAPPQQHESLMVQPQREQQRVVDSLLENALSGNCVWLGGDEHENVFEFSPPKPKPEDAVVETLVQLDQRNVLHEQLTAEAASRDESLQQLKEQIREKEQQRDVLLEQLEAARQRR